MVRLFQKYSDAKGFRFLSYWKDDGPMYRFKRSLLGFFYGKSGDFAGDNLTLEVHFLFLNFRKVFWVKSYYDWLGMRMEA